MRILKKIDSKVNDEMFVKYTPKNKQQQKCIDGKN